MQVLPQPTSFNNSDSTCGARAVANSIKKGFPVIKIREPFFLTPVCLELPKPTSCSCVVVSLLLYFRISSLLLFASPNLKQRRLPRSLAGDFFQLRIFQPQRFRHVHFRLL